MGRTVISDDGMFEWDEDKNRINLAKHGMEFGEILDMFYDPLMLEGYDSSHSSHGEHRYIGIARWRNYLLLTASYLEHGNRIRLIGARKSTVKEKEAYCGYLKKNL